MTILLFILRLLAAVVFYSVLLQFVVGFGGFAIMMGSILLQKIKFRA